MARIVVIGSSPLLVRGLVDALSGVDGWVVEVRSVPDDADAIVLTSQAADALAPWPPGVPAVVVGDEPRDASPRAESRALALLSASATPAQLRAAVGAVLQGLSVRDAESSWSAGAATVMAGDHEPLTPRELEVYELLGKGLSNRDIAGVLGISAHTAKYHVGQILAKVGAATRAEAVSAGLRMGIIGL